MGAPAWEFSATGTRWRLYHSGALNASVAATAQEAVRADEARWSRFRDDSETTRLNRRAGTWVAVSEETFALLAACREWTERSGGVFQPLVGRVLAAAGYDASIDRRAPGAAVTPVARPVRAELGLRRADRTVRVPPGTALDLGGIGKGWIADRLAGRLPELRRDPSLLIDAGGDLVAVSGAHRVAVEDPGDGDVATTIVLAAGDAVATSGFGRRQWTNGDGGRSHHLIDPHTGASGPRSHATLVAPTSVEADIGAKLLALRPRTLATCRSPACVRDARGWTANAAWRALVARSSAR